MVVAHNMLAMNANRMFGINTNARAKSTEKLSSGYKINRSADDAAGLAISEKMRRKIRGLTQGIENTQDGVSLCQVADGALSEVNDMLHRLTELSVKSANDTNSLEDRKYIQEEVNQILDEINRIGDTTNFNEIPLFKGTEKQLFNTDGTIGTWKDIGYDDIKFTDVSLTGAPITATSKANYLNFCAAIDKPGHALDATTIDAIWGKGTTSKVAARISYLDDNGNEIKRDIDLSRLASNNFTEEILPDGSKFYEKYYEYSDGLINLRFREFVRTTSDTSYMQRFEVENSNDRKIVCDFMHHLDTAYNNDDECEEYFVDGKKISQSAVYNLDQTGGHKSENPFYKDPGLVQAHSNYTISIINSHDALPYSEKINFLASHGVLAVGNYWDIKQWGFYDDITNNTGKSTQNEDMGLAHITRVTMDSFVYDPAYPDDLYDSHILSWMNFRLDDATTDSNLNGVPIEFNKNTATRHVTENDIWIQSGNEAGDGVHLHIGEMNTEVLGLKGLNVLTGSDAAESIDKIKGALANISENRSKIGAQQNRLEHTVQNESNIVENTTVAESQIRDTDMAKEMVNMANLNILDQVGQSMLAQANQNKQGILSLLQ